MKIIDDAKKDLNDFFNSPNLYQKRVDTLSNDLGFTGDYSFRSSYMPTYYAGDLSKENMIVIVGANPGWNETSNVKEEACKKKDYFGFLNNFFLEFYKNGCKSRYYENRNTIGGLIQGLTGKQTDCREEKYAILQNHVINIDVIPYHSKKFGTPADTPIANDQLDIFKCNLKKYIQELKKPRLIIFNTAITKKLLDLKINDNDSLTFVRKKHNNKVYMFTYNGIRSIYFDAQIGSRANPTSNRDMKSVADYILETEKTK